MTNSSARQAEPPFDFAQDKLRGVASPGPGPQARHDAQGDSLGRTRSKAAAARRPNTGIAIGSDVVAVWLGWLMIGLFFMFWIMLVAGLVSLFWSASTVSGIYYSPPMSSSLYPYRCSHWVNTIAWVEFSFTICLH